jgi:predicted PurR-regulated permease PerM
VVNAKVSKAHEGDAPEEAAMPAPLEIAVRVPAATIAKLLLAAGLVFVLIRLLPALVLVFVAVLLAVTLDPLVRLLERRGLSRSLAVAVVALVALGVVGLFLAVALPPLVSQSVDFFQHLNSYRKIVSNRLHANYPVLASVADQMFDVPSSPDVASLKEPLAWGAVAARVAEGIVLTLALSFYLLIDGKRTYAWLLAYVPRRHRRKMALTMPDVSDVVTAYMQGQVITSAIAGAFAFAVLSVLGVPAALPLALLVAVCDVLPILGIFVSTVPAVLFALTVSPLAAAAVLALYLLYHAFENYVIIPRVYGKRLRLSTLVVLLALILGGTVGGVVGAVLILPLVAAYPIVERVWLRDYLGQEVAADHRVLERTAESGSDRAVDAIMRGAKHETEIHDPAATKRARRAEREGR